MGRERTQKSYNMRKEEDQGKNIHRCAEEYRRRWGRET
jgi:hypothetical protein